MKDNKPTRSSRKSGSVSVENDNSDRDAVKEAEVKDEAANMSASSPNGSQAGNGIEEKPRLSEGEKKANHIASGLCSPFALCSDLRKVFGMRVKGYDMACSR